MKCFMLSSIFSGLVILVSLVGLTALTGCLGVKPSELVFRLVDVNEPEYYNDAHIKEAINAPAQKLESESKSWDKNDNIVIYCTDYLCSESTRLAKKLIASGFNNISVYKGGTHEWYQLSLKEPDKYIIEGEALKKYLQRPVEKITPENISIKVISAEDLSKILAA